MFGDCYNYCDNYVSDDEWIVCHNCENSFVIWNFREDMDVFCPICGSLITFTEGYHVHT